MAAFLPFGLLDDDDEPSAVFGDSVAEAKSVAWAMTAAAYSDSDSAAQGVVQACEARRRRVRGGCMLNDLLGLGLAEVDVGAFGKKHGAAFKIDALDECHDDRLYKRRVDAEVQKSMRAWIRALDLDCAWLDGQDVDQTCSSALEETMRVRNLVVEELSRVINNGASAEDVAARARQLEATYGGRALRKRRAILDEAFAGVKALAGVAAAASEGRSVEEAMERDYAAIKEVCLSPPRQLVDALALSGISLSLLTACFPQTGVRSLVGASSLAPAWQKTTAIVGDYFRRVDACGTFRNACVAAMTAIRSEISDPDSSPAWSGVALAAGIPAGQQQACWLRPPPHCEGTAMALVSTQARPRALRVVRLLRAVTLAAEVGMFRPRHVRATLIVPSVARFRADASFDELDAVASVVQPVANATGVPWPCEDGDDTGATSLVPETSAPSNPLPAAAEAVPTQCSVPLELERDFHILSAMGVRLPAGGVLPVKEVAKALMGGGLFFSKSTVRSVEQAVAFVARRAVDKASCDLSRDAVLEYQSAVLNVRGSSAHIRCDAQGARVFKDFLLNSVRAMRADGEAFSAEWHVSRSSRQKAKAAAVRAAVCSE